MAVVGPDREGKCRFSRTPVVASFPPGQVQDEVYAIGRLLEQFGPQLGRPQVDTLHGSRHANMKEMRFSAVDGAWRVAFAFNPARQAVVLVAGEKTGRSRRRFYRALTRKADERYDRHLARLAEERRGES